MPNNEVDIARAAGLFEGEGTIYTNVQKGGKYSYPRMSLRMTDSDIVYRFAAIVDCGIVKDYPPYQENRQSTTNWTLNKAAEIRKVIAAFWPYLGERRREKAGEVLAI